MANIHFKKENVNNPVRDSQNQVILWERLPDGNGVLSVDEGSPVASDLKNFAGNRVGGVVTISAEIYDSLKKNPPQPVSQQRSPSSNLLNQIRVHQNPAPFGRPSAAPSAGVAPGAKVKGPLPPTDQDAPNFVAYRARRIQASQLGGLRVNRPQE